MACIISQVFRPFSGSLLSLTSKTSEQSCSEIYPGFELARTMTSTLFSSLLECWKRKRTKSEIEFALMMMTMKKREENALWDHERNFNGIMRSGLHNLDIKATCDLLHFQLLRIMHFNICILVSEEQH